MTRGRRSSSDGSNWPIYRSKHRERSHQEAHEDDAGDLESPEFEHELVPSGELRLITRSDELRTLVNTLRSAGQFGYDTEFIGEQSYYPRICLIQTATAETVTLIDALASLDLDPFWELLSDDSVEKIVHAGEQDVEPVLRYRGTSPRNIFDTQVAAGFIGERYPSGLTGLIESRIGITLPRGTKFSQWDRRPLSSRQLQYAANDVRYLPLLRTLIGEQLEQLGNTDWALEECIATTDPARLRTDPADQRLRVRGVEYLDHKQRTTLRALLRWRDEAARTHDVPPRAILKDGVLLELARTSIESVETLAGIRGLPRPVRQHWGTTIVDATRAAIAEAVHTDPPPTGPPWRSSSEVRAKVDELWQLISERAVEHSIDPALVTSKKELGQLVLQAIRSGEGDDLAVSRLGRGWRRELIGDLLHGRLRP